MHPTVERTLEVIRKKSEDTGVDITDALEEWVKEVGTGMLEQCLYALGPNLNMADGMFDMSFFVPEDGQLLSLEDAVVVFHRQLLYNVLYELLLGAGDGSSSDEPESGQKRYNWLLQQDITTHSPDSGPRT